MKTQKSDDELFSGAEETDTQAASVWISKNIIRLTKFCVISIMFVY